MSPPASIKFSKIRSYKSWTTGSNEATALYAVASASKSDEGAYVCEATNEAGSREEMVQVSQSTAGEGADLSLLNDSWIL